MTQTLTVPLPSLAAMAVSGLLSVAVPVLLAVLCVRRRRSALRAVGMGAACFLLFVLVLESGVNYLVGNVLFPTLLRQPAAYVIYGCLAAGLFEESARLFGLRILCRRDAAPVTGFAYGVGHGGVEALMLGTLASVNNLANASLINSGQVQSLLASVPQEQRALAQSQLAELAATPPSTFLAPGVERMSALALHIALSVLIWMVVCRRLPAWGYAVAVLLHAGQDVFAALYQLGILQNVWLVEGLVALGSALICVGVAWVYRRHVPQPGEGSAAPHAGKDALP